MQFIDTLKNYQKRLGQLAATLSEEEKLAIKKVAEPFIMSRYYFSETWKYLGSIQKENILNIMADGKGIKPYEKIVDLNSFSLTPEEGIFFEKCEFYSDLKQKSVNDEDYESSMYLYKTLKMRNLGDMDDLYNMYSFNPRKCNSGSSLSGSIERDLSKVIFAHLTTNEMLIYLNKL